MMQIYVAIVTAFKTSVSYESEVYHLGSYRYMLIIKYVVFEGIMLDIFEAVDLIKDGFLRISMRV